MSETNNETKDYKYIDYLTEDVPLHGQLYVCLSFLSPENVENCNVRGLKVRGVYASESQAKQRCEELQKLDPDFHVFIGEVGKWLPWDPDPNSVKDQIYYEQQLNNLMKNKLNNSEKATTFEAQRKQDLLKASVNEKKARDQLLKEQKSLETQSVSNELQKNLDKLKESKLGGKKRKVKKTDKKLQAATKLVEEENKRLNNLDKTIKEDEQTLKQYDDTITKINSLFKKLKNHDSKNEDKPQSTTSTN